jgi:cyanophycin synthetase
LNKATSGRAKAELRGLRLIPGYLPGRTQTTVAALLVYKSNAISNRQLALFDKIITDHLVQGPESGPGEMPSKDPLFGRLAWAMREVMVSAGLPLFDDIDVAVRRQKDGVTGTFLIPALEQAPGTVELTLTALLEIVNAILAGKKPRAVDDKLEPVRTTIGKVAPRGINSLLFLKAAHEAGIPWRNVRSNVYQYGWGSKARWLDSSFTDQTPSVSASVVRDKVAAAAVLRKAGLPVPEHRMVSSANAAVEHAMHLGFPVVVKPADLDGGRGVFPFLKNEHAVRDAYNKAAELSQKILVEKHFEGNDYRLQVYRDDVFWIAHRVPGGVTGNGIDTVEQLLDELNADPMRGEPGSNAWRKRIPLDDEALELLREQELGRDSVPDQGQFVRLRRACNVASGGVPVPALEGAHPDNLELAARITRVLRLDLAGIDLLIPDIKQSWRNSGAAICEVNAQPQLSRHLPALLLDRLLIDKGRIPSIVVVGDLQQQPWYVDLQAWVADSGCSMGLATSDGIWIDGSHTGTTRSTAFESGVAMLLDPKVDLAVFQLTDDSVTETGLAIDRADLLVVLESIQSPSETDRNRNRRLLNMVGRMSKSTCVSEHLKEFPGATELADLSNVEFLPSEQILGRIKYCIEGKL